jgi:enoyl-CoA hydratase/carnithine racemase
VGAIAIVTLDSPPVNAVSNLMRAGLRSAFTLVRLHDDVGAVVLICAGRTFIAGADGLRRTVATGGFLTDIQAFPRPTC